MIWVSDSWKGLGWSWGLGCDFGLRFGVEGEGVGANACCWFSGRINVWILSFLDILFFCIKLYYF